VWEGFRIEPERFVDAGDRVVVIEVRRGRGSGSGVEVEQRSGVIWTLREGKVVGMETDLDPQEALEAAGPQE
jgi:ketosteroid isomerase-like protein